MPSFPEIFRFVLLCLLTLGSSAAQAALTVTFDPKPPQGQPVGTVIRWSATADGAGTDPVLFRFDVAPPGGSFRLLKDYYLLNFADWTPTEEGSYWIKVTARNWITGETAESVTGYWATSRVTGANPVISPTANPLVALYSAPPCPFGRVRVQYRAAGALFKQTTPFQPCKPGVSVNFYVAGMRENTNYLMRQEWVFFGTTIRGPILSFQTGSLPVELSQPQALLLNPPNQQSSLNEGVLLHSRTFNAIFGGLDYPFATDLLGRVIWYHIPEIPPMPKWVTVTRPLPGGRLLMTVPFNVLREIDLAGNILRETNTFAIEEQLRSQVTDPLGTFHHEAIRLPNGHTLALASVERIVTDVQGPGPVNVLGDILLDLDENWRVAWFWNSFDFLDVSRRAVLGETCAGPDSGCSPLRLGPDANDWTHSNSIHYLPADGNLLLSVRHQDWVIKIDYRDGAGTGEVLWRMGRDGDFRIAPVDDPELWFTHQHDVSYDGNTLLVYDNGNTRQALNPDVHSRGQVLRVDEDLRQVMLELNVDLGHYAKAVGSAQRLSNGNYHFLSGMLQPGFFSLSIELLPNGQNNYVLQVPTIIYRSFRMKSLYEPLEGIP